MAAAISWSANCNDDCRMNIISIVLLIAPVATMFAQAIREPPPQSKYPIVRLPPRDFLELPADLVRKLQRRGCTIPQPKETLLSPR
jgi:hypothetical protein